MPGRAAHRRSAGRQHQREQRRTCPADYSAFRRPVLFHIRSAGAAGRQSRGIPAPAARGQRGISALRHRHQGSGRHWLLRSRRKGVLAEVGAVLLDADGTEVATDFTERCISISGRQLRTIDEVVGVAGGTAKAAAVRAVIAGGYAKSLVADSSLATALLAQVGS